MIHPSAWSHRGPAQLLRDCRARHPRARHGLDAGGRALRALGLAHAFHPFGRRPQLSAGGRRRSPLPCSSPNHHSEDPRIFHFQRETRAKKWVRFAISEILQLCTYPKNAPINKSAIKIRLGSHGQPPLARAWTRARARARAPARAQAAHERRRHPLTKPLHIKH